MSGPLDYPRKIGPTDGFPPAGGGGGGVTSVNGETGAVVLQITPPWNQIDLTPLAGLISLASLDLSAQTGVSGVIAGILAASGETLAPNGYFQFNGAGPFKDTTDNVLRSAGCPMAGGTGGVALVLTIQNNSLAITAKTQTNAYNAGTITVQQAGSAGIYVDADGNIVISMTGVQDNGTNMAAYPITGPGAGIYTFAPGTYPGNTIPILSTTAFTDTAPINAQFVPGVMPTGQTVADGAVCQLNSAGTAIKYIMTPVNGSTVIAYSALQQAVGATSIVIPNAGTSTPTDTYFRSAIWDNQYIVEFNYTLLAVNQSAALDTITDPNGPGAAVVQACVSGPMFTHQNLSGVSRMILGMVVVGSGWDQAINVLAYGLPNQATSGPGFLSAFTVFGAETPIMVQGSAAMGMVTLT